MLFNSYTFIYVFLPCVLVGWWVLTRYTRLRLAWLTLASYGFYSYFEFPRGLELLPLLLASTSADFIAGRRIAASDNSSVRRRWLIAALSVNLGLLFFFKYLGFFEGIGNSLLALSGVHVQVPVHTLILPIGISFYTFNSMSYTIDIYRRRVEPARTFLHYSAFVSLFPHLIAGPIVRYSDIASQLHSLKRRITPTLVSVGLFFFICGLTKKLLFADVLAPSVDKLFAAEHALTMVSGWAAALGYSLQIYFDFSGYSDMAVGLACMLGLTFPQNFASPYKAANISDFWRRWHITMSRWMRDYLFIPLGGSQGSRIFTARNLAITMVCVGLWHGAAWTFVVFGCMQGTLLGMHAMLRSAGLPTLPSWLGRTLTYLSFVISLVVFRSPNLDTAGTVLAAMFGTHGIGLGQLGVLHGAGAVSMLFALEIIALLVWVNTMPNTFEYNLKPRRRTAVMLGLAFAVNMVLIAAPSPFLYFQF